MSIKVTLAQLAPVLGDKKANIKMMEKEVGRAAKEGAGLVVFGEMFLTGYRIKDRVARLAEKEGGPSIKALAKVAKKKDCHILFGMPEKDGRVRGLIYNSAVLIRPDKKVDIYRKWFLPNFGPFEEKIHYTPGKDIKVFDTDLGRLGVIICYDMFFPELSKALALKGADMLINISAAPSSTGHFFQLLARARAVENALPFLYCNLAGTEGGLKFFGGSVVVGPRGNILAQGKLYEEDRVSVEVDLKEIELARFHRPTMRDTRSEVFDHLKGPF